MSLDQREQIKTITSAFMKVLLGVSGAALTVAYYQQAEQTSEFRREVRDSFNEIQIESRGTKDFIEQIKSDVRLIDYRLKQIEK